MKNRTLFFMLSAIGLTLGCGTLSGCGYIKSYQARSAYGHYQQALAVGDMDSARRALMKLVQVQEDVPDYWIELGKLQLQSGDYREAYDAFAHAHELDRTNIPVLATMAQLALLSKQIDLANEQAQSLALVAPDHPTVTLVRAYVALKAGDLDKADAGADSLLAISPDDPFAKGLKAEVLIARNRIDDAVALLEQQHQTAPEDRATIRALIAIYRSRDDWRNFARIAFDAYRLDPKNSKLALTAVEGFLRAGDVSAAGQLSAPFLTPQAKPELVDAVLDSWSRYAPKGTLPPRATQLANGASGEQRVSFANYFNRIGKPEIAAELLGNSQLPVTHVNARHNAVLAQSLALKGRAADAKRLFDLVLDREPDQVDALRGRSLLEAHTGATKQAVIDAQRLVTISPASGEDRLILAQAYLAAGNKADVRRTLWQAFQDLPEDERVFSALRSVLASSGDQDGQRRLGDELADRHRTMLKKELI